jgi:hypothetical protein
MVVIEGLAEGWLIMFVLMLGIPIGAGQNSKHVGAL